MGKATRSATIEVLELKQESVEFCVLGTTPLIFNRMSEKAKRELLYPSHKNRAAQKASLKHDPIEEYRSSVHRLTSGATRLAFPSPAFKGAMATAALEIPGAAKTSINRLLYVEGYSIPIYGVPMIHMVGVVQAGMSRSPDIRTRAILPEWACKIRVRYVAPNLKAPAVSNLMAAAGVIVGVGDFRQEKGKGNFGLFELVERTDKRFQKIIKTGGAKTQDAALTEPEPYDADTDDLLRWFEAEAVARGHKVAEEVAA